MTSSVKTIIGEMAWLFMVYSFIGWVWETTNVSIIEKKYVNRGFLRGPFIPLYGFAATTIMFSMQLIEAILPTNLYASTIISMLYIAIVASTWEFSTSVLMEWAFKTRWWDYTSHRFNIKGRVALDASLFWGIGGFVLWRFVNTPIVDFYVQMDAITSAIILDVFYFILTVDAIFTLKELVTLRGIVIKLHEVSEELSSHVEDFAEAFEVVKDDIKLKVQYRRIEGLNNFELFIDSVVNNSKQWAEEHDKELERYSNLLKKAKQHSRFYRKYPNASTKKLSSIFSSFKDK